jgi:DivIVA domain-containing protein
VAKDTPAGPKTREAARPTQRFARARASSAERDRMSDDVRDVDFPVAMRGYDRAAVDGYVEQVNRLIAELEISSSPESAVRHALEEVTEETRGILQGAHETAEEITARSRSKADDRLQRGEREADEARKAAAREAQETREMARREAQELRESAAHAAQHLHETAQRETQELRETAARETLELRETAAREAQHVRTTAQREMEEMRAAAEERVRQLDRNAEAIWQARHRLIDDMGAVAQQLQEIAHAEAERFPRAVGPPAGGSALADDSVAEEEPATVEELPAVRPERGEEGSSYPSGDAEVDPEQQQRPEQDREKRG